MERHSPLVDAELHGSCVRICTLMALERRLPAPDRSRVYSCAWISNMDKQTHRTLRHSPSGRHAPRQYICLAARLAFHQERKRNASPAHRRPRRTHPQRPLDEPTARRFALAGPLLGRRTRLSARSEELYRNAVEHLTAAGLTYPCFCTEPSSTPRARRMRAMDPVYAGTCRNLTPAGSCRPKRDEAARNAPSSLCILANHPKAEPSRLPTASSGRATADHSLWIAEISSSGAARSSPISLPLWLTMQRWE